MASRKNKNRNIVKQPLTRQRRRRHWYLLPFGLAVACLVSLQYSIRPEDLLLLHDSSQFLTQLDKFTKPQTQQQQQRLARLGDGCYHVFLDVGANVGVHGRFLFEPQKYPESTTSVHLLQTEYGLLNNNNNKNNVCVFAFEANAKHWPRLDEISKAYRAMGWRYHVIEAAVSDVNGKTTFFHQGTEDEKFNEWAFSAAKDYRDTYMGKPGGGSTVTVPTIRLSEWIQTHIHERIVVPPTNNNNHHNSKQLTPPVLGMKLDIEGYEFVVMPDLIHSGVLCHFDFIFGEFHPKMAPLEEFRNTSRVSLETRKEARDFANSLTTVLQSARYCPVRWSSIDDESYLHDGQPLPTMPSSSK